MTSLLPRAFSIATVFSLIIPISFQRSVTFTIQVNNISKMATTTSEEIAATTPVEAPKETAVEEKPEATAAVESTEVEVKETAEERDALSFLNCSTDCSAARVDCMQGWSVPDCAVPSCSATETLEALSALPAALMAASPFHKAPAVEKTEEDKAEEEESKPAEEEETAAKALPEPAAGDVKEEKAEEEPAAEDPTAEEEPAAEEEPVAEIKEVS